MLRSVSPVLSQESKPSQLAKSSFQDHFKPVVGGNEYRQPSGLILLELSFWKQMQSCPDFTIRFDTIRPCRTTPALIKMSMNPLLM